MKQNLFSILYFKSFILPHLAFQKVGLVLIFISILSLCPGQKPMMDEMEYWRLSYRMVWNQEFGKNSLLAEKQVDSMLMFSNTIEDKVLHVTMKCLYKNNRLNQIKELLLTVDSASNAYLCTKELFKYELNDLLNCKNFDEKEIVENSELQRKLVIMFIDDQNVRSNRMENLIKKYNISEDEMIGNKDYSRDPDLENQIKLKEIIKTYSFPTKKLVGEDGMDAVFYIIQHADDLEWQAAQLTNVEKAVKAGDMKMRDFVYLHDRIKLHANLPQRWGTQCVSVKNNKVVLHTVEDPENLDKRRKEVGLEPIEFYKKLMLLN